MGTSKCGESCGKKIASGYKKMSSQNEPKMRESCRKRKPVTCRYCDNCDSSSELKSLFRKHSSITIDGPSNFSERDTPHKKFLSDDRAHCHYGLSLKNTQSGRSVIRNQTFGQKKCDLQLRFPIRCQDEPFSRYVDECGLTCKNKHQRDDVHRVREGNEKSQFDSVEYTLTTCKKKYSHLRTDLSNVHGSGKEGEEKAFICEECGKSFERQFSLQVHSLCVHDGRTCGSELIKSSELQFQEGNGGGVEKRFKCDDCGAISKTRRNFRRHLISCHSEERPFFCAKCGHTFKQRDDLRAHFKRSLHHVETIEPDRRLGTARCKFENQSEERRRGLTSDQLREKYSLSDKSGNSFKGWSITADESRDIDVKPSVSELQLQLLPNISTLVPPVYTISRHGVREVEYGKLARRSSNSAKNRRKSNVCLSCCESFNQYDKLIRHAKICEKYSLLCAEERRKRRGGRRKRRREYGCSICGSTFSSARSMNAHLGKTHGTNFFFHMCEQHTTCRKKIRPQFTF